MDVKEPMINETMEYVISFLEKLVNIPSPSGYTDAAMQAMEQEAASWGYQSTYNRKGGLVITVPGRQKEALCLSARSYQKLEQGVHLPCATTLALFLGQLSEEVLAFVRTFAQLVETARSQEVPDTTEATPCFPEKVPRPRGT